MWTWEAILKRSQNPYMQTYLGNYMLFFVFVYNAAIVYTIPYVLHTKLYARVFFMTEFLQFTQSTMRSMFVEITHNALNNTMTGQQLRRDNGKLCHDSKFSS